MTSRYTNCARCNKKVQKITIKNKICGTCRRLDANKRATLEARNTSVKHRKANSSNNSNPKSYESAYLIVCVLFIVIVFFSIIKPDESDAPESTTFSGKQTMSEPDYEKRYREAKAEDDRLFLTASNQKFSELKNKSIDYYVDQDLTHYSALYTFHMKNGEIITCERGIKSDRLFFECD